MSKIKAFAGQTVIYGGGHILSKIVYYLLVTVLLTRLIGKDIGQFSTLGYFYGYMTILMVIFSFRLDTAFFRFGSEKKQIAPAYKTAFPIITLAAILSVILGFVFDDQIASITDYPDSPRFVRWFTLILAFDIISYIPFARLRLENKAKAFALVKIFGVALSSILILFFLFVVPKSNLFSFIPKYEEVDYVFIANVIASGLVLLVLLVITKSSKLSIDKTLLRKMFYYASPLVIVGIANGMIQFFSVPLQNALLPDVLENNKIQSGLFDSSRRIAMLFAMFTTAFNYAAEPFFFNNSSKEDKALYYGKICRLFTLVGGLVILVMVYGIDLIQYIVGESFRESIYIIPVLLIAYLFLGIYYNVSIWYKLSDKTKYGAMISTLGLVIFLGANVIFLPSHGYITTAYATVLTYGIMVVVAYLFGQKEYPINYPVGKIVINVIIIIVLIAVDAYVAKSINGLLRYFVSGTFMMLYIVYMYLSEREVWNTILKIKNS